MPSVRDIMARHPVVVAPSTALREAARVMHAGNINSVVVTRDGEVEGILTSHDVLRHAGAPETDDDATVADFMTPDPVTIEADTSFAAAIELMDERHVRHLPVTDGGRLVGIVSVRDLMHHRAAVLQEVVEQQTAELQARHRTLQERDRHMRYHLELAARIQKQLLPARVPRMPPLSLAVSYHPLDQVSGDMYEFLELAPDRLGLLIADARGHGVPAAFVSIMARMVFQAWVRDGESPAAVLRSINDRLPRLIRTEHFLTMCYAVIDRRSLRLTYATAGHPPPLWFRHRRRAVEPLAARGDMIGVMADPVFEERTIQLRPHDTVLFYTDGLHECRDDAGTPFGRGRLEAILLECGERGSGHLVELVHRALTAFNGQDSFDDDVTCVALSVEKLKAER